MKTHAIYDISVNYHLLLWLHMDKMNLESYLSQTSIISLIEGNRSFIWIPTRMNKRTISATVCSSLERSNYYNFFLPKWSLLLWNSCVSSSEFWNKTEQILLLHRRTFHGDYNENTPLMFTYVNELLIIYNTNKNCKVFISSAPAEFKR